MKKFLCLSLAVLALTALLAGCLSDGNHTIVLPDKAYTPGEGEVPLSIIPAAIRESIEGSMPIFSGVTPPDISGQYLGNNITLVGSSLGEAAGSGMWADIYFTFISVENGKIAYREKNASSVGESDDVLVGVVGTANDFTAYFEKIGSKESGVTRSTTSTIISGTLTSNGISNFHYAFVMLEKYDPNNELVPVNTYRIFKDSDGLAARNHWYDE